MNRQWSALRFATLCTSLTVLGCRCATPPPPPSTEPSSTATPRPQAESKRRLDAAASEPKDAESEAPGLAPLAAHGPFVSMEVEGFEPAVVALPLGATTKRPVIVALHGNFDRPEWQCEVWRDIVSAYAFVLCPRGVRRADAPKKWDRWTYAGAKKTEAELEAGLLALRAEFGDYLAEGSVLFTGFSLGAIYGVGIIHRKPERYSEAILVEGGFKGWSAKLASDYAKGGGRRVLFGCGQAGCRTAAKAAAKVLERQGVATQVAYAGPTGHTYDGKVADAVAQNLSWITEDNPTWGGLTSKMPTGEAH